MKEINSLARNFRDRVRQFGWGIALVQAARAVLRPVWAKNQQIVFAVIDHQPEPFNDPQVRQVTEVELDQLAQSGRLGECEYERVRRFLHAGCSGFVAESAGRIGGFAFVQASGNYDFGGNGRLQIGEDLLVLKNLLVLPEFRGSSLGKKLNLARLASCPEGSTPVVFVIPENRYAIRNLKMFGFEEVLLVSITTWLGKYATLRTEVVRDCKASYQVSNNIAMTQRV